MTVLSIDRQIRHRLAVLRHADEVSKNVSATCRYFGITRQTFYTWEKRYRLEGEAGLQERSRAPKSSPRATQSEVVGKIIYLRQNYHFGPEKIAMYLARYHDVRISSSGIWRILKKFDLNRLPSSQRYQRHDRKWKRYEKQLPGHQIQIDVKFIDALQGSGRRKKFYQFTAIDDCTRLRVLRLYPHCDMKTAISFYDYVASRMPFTIERVQTDNGSEFQTAFHLHLLDQGVEHHYIKPATPRLNGKVERSHRIDAEEFYRLLDGVIIDDTKLFNDKLQEWEDYYNYHRPHGGLAGATPYERLKEKTTSHNPDTTVRDVRQLHNRALSRLTSLTMTRLPKNRGIARVAGAKSLTTHSELCVRDNIFSVCKSSRLYQWVTGRQLFSGIINYFLTCQVVLPSLLTMQTS